MEAGAGTGDEKKTVAAAPITSVIAAQVRRLRKEARLSGPALAARLEKLGLNWNRTTVAKFETGARNSISVQELLALALALDVPLIMLLADPRHVDEVPVAKGLTPSAWEALLWLTGSGTIDKSDLDNFTSAAWLIHAGWGIVENLTELQKRERILNPGDPDEVERAQQRDDARHRSALRGIATAITRIEAAGAPLPPILPMDMLRRRATELELDLPELGG